MPKEQIRPQISKEEQIGFHKGSVTTAKSVDALVAFSRAECNEGDSNGKN